MPELATQYKKHINVQNEGPVDNSRACSAAMQRVLMFRKRLATPTPCTFDFGVEAQ